MASIKALEKAAITYAKSYLTLVRAHEDAEKVRGLDEFDPKHIAWENKVYHAEQRRDKAIDNLKSASIEFGVKKLKMRIPNDVKEFLKYLKIMNKRKK